MTARHRGGGHKRLYRVIDFRRDKVGVRAVVQAIEYDPNRSARIALLTYTDGARGYILAPVGLGVGDAVETGPQADIKPGNSLPLANIPLGTTVHAVELRPGRRAERGRGHPADGERGRLRVAEAPVDGAAARAPRLPRDGWTGRQPRAREPVARQGRPGALARAPVARAWDRHEPGGPSPWRRGG